MRLLKSSEHYVRRIVTKIKSGKEEYASRLDYIKQLERLPNTRSRTRTYWDYNTFFSYGLSNFFGAEHGSILQALKISAGERTSAFVLDDGAGKGNFLESLKEESEKVGLKIHTTAIAFSPDATLEQRKRAKIIDEVVYGPAELRRFRRKYNAILSMFGSMHYVLPGLQKEHLLKFAHALEKKGVMMVGINDRAKPIPTREIERAFEKQGFRAKFYWYPKHPVDREYGVDGLPDIMLIVQRLR